MKRLACLAVLALAACGDNLVPTPVDMEYHVAVTDLGGDCGAPLSDTTAWLDLKLRTDGSVRMTGWVPGLLVQPSFLHLYPQDGGLDADIRDQYGDTYHVNGTLTMEDMDLSLDFPSYRPDGSGKACRQRLRLQGGGRGLRDPSSFDGVYPLATDYFGVYCDGQPIPTVPVGSGLFRLDAEPREGKLWVDLEHGFWFSGPLPGQDGAVDWSGTYYLAGERGIEEVTGTFKGVYAPGHVDVALEFSDAGLSAHCRYRYEMRGAKRTASLETVTNVYRAVYRTIDSCSPEDVYAYEAETEIDPYGEGNVAVFDASGGAWVIGFDGRTLSASGGSEQIGEVVSLVGTADPPFLNYRFEDRVLQGDGSWCTYGWEVDAVTRYFPEQPWEPAFQPDPPTTSFPRALKRTAASGLTRGLGPLSRP